MRWVKLCAAAALCLTLCGCTFFSPVNELLSAPVFSAQDEALRRAFETSFGKNVQYKAPVSGQYLSAFVVEDLDADGDMEALVFYQPDSFTSTVHIGVLDRANGAWERTGELEGGGSDVYSVEMEDLDADGQQEVILCWNIQENTRVMSVYACASGPFTLARLSESRYSKKLVADLDDDGHLEIFTISLVSEAGSQTAQARVLRKTPVGISVLDQCALDGRISSYADLILQKTDSGSILYADAYKGEGQMITEVIVWDAGTSTISAPLLDEETLTNESTWRCIRVFCRDLNGDGAPEIPSQLELLEGEGEWTEDLLFITRWSTFRDGMLEPVYQTLVNENCHWIFRIPAPWRGRFTVQREPQEEKWTFIRIDPLTQERTDNLFSVLFLDRRQWEKNRESTYAQCTLLRETDSEVVLVYGIQTDEALDLQLTVLREAFDYIGE